MTLANVQQLQRYDWPGNVRELQHVIERAVITADRGRLAIELPAAAEPPSGSADAPAHDAADRVLTEAEVRRLEAENIRAALRRTGGKVSGAGGAAELLGMKPTTLASRIKALGLSPRSPGSSDSRRKTIGRGDNEYRVPNWPATPPGTGVTSRKIGTSFRIGRSRGDLPLGGQGLCAGLN